MRMKEGKIGRRKRRKNENDENIIFRRRKTFFRCLILEHTNVERGRAVCRHLFLLAKSSLPKESWRISLRKY